MGEGSIVRVGQILIAFPKKVHKQRLRIQSNGQLMEKLWACAEGARLVRFAVTTFAPRFGWLLGFRVGVGLVLGGFACGFRMEYGDFTMFEAGIGWVYDGCFKGLILSRRFLVDFHIGWVYI